MDETSKVRESQPEVWKELSKEEMDDVTGGWYFRYYQSPAVMFESMFASFAQGKETLNRCETLVGDREHRRETLIASRDGAYKED